MPSASSCGMARTPSRVAGTLMKRFGRSTSHHSPRASATVRSVSRATRGSTSMDTRPSRPPVASKTGRRTSQAARTSQALTARAASSTATPRRARSRT